MQNVHGKNNPAEKMYEVVSSMKQEDESIDAVLEGRLKVIQKVKGYRFSVDAYLLAHFVHLNENDHVMDMGTGSAVIAMIVAKRWEQVKIIGLDVQSEMVDMAGRNVALNGLENKINIRQGDVRTAEALFDRRSFDAVILNPPYRKLRSGRVNPDYQKSVARHEIKGSLGDFLKAAGYVLKTSGRVFIIYPASRMVELICRMRDTSIEPKRLQVVYSHDRSRGEFVLLEGIKGGKEEMQVLPPLFIYAGNGTYTEEMTRLFREISVAP
jgi:tRNA1Val (adenine37-N6)-methyltransferase